jgi:hypothetical protein
MDDRVLTMRELNTILRAIICKELARAIYDIVAGDREKRILADESLKAWGRSHCIA